MIDYTHHFARGRVRYRLLVRAWWQSPLWHLFGALVGRYWLNRELTLRTWTGHNGNCYCYTGSTSTFRLCFAGVGLWVELSRDPTRRPCWCDAVICRMSPDDYAGDIEEAGGMDSLAPRFPEFVNVVPS